LIIDIQNTEKKRKKIQREEKDFLGNTRTDRFVGLINRKEILVGNKITAKRLRLDKKLTLNPKKVRKGKRRQIKKKVGVSIGKRTKIW